MAQMIVFIALMILAIPACALYESHQRRMNKLESRTMYFSKGDRSCQE